MLVNVVRLLERTEAHASHGGDTFEAETQSRATVGSRGAGLPLDGGGSGGNRGLSADAVTDFLHVFLRLASRGWQLNLLC
jgi:hypothetical protein